MLVDLALIGFGNVARRFVRLLNERRTALERDFDLTWRVTAIATQRHGQAHDPNGLDALDSARAIDNGGTLNLQATATTSEIIERLSRSPAPIKALIETTTLDIVSGQPAIDHVRSALDAGCHAITANKGPAAFAYRQLATLAADRGVSFLFEGSVMDGIPVFNLVRETMASVEVLGFRGVVNSTTNHILTALERGQEFAPALAHMQAIGIAEAVPSLDVEGWDAAAKAAILANVFLDASITPRDVDRTGIGPDTAARARAAKDKGCRLRLVAAALRGLSAEVRPVDLPADDLLAGLDGTANALILDTDTLGRVAICQLDGGLTHTAYALLSDLISVRRRIRP